MSLVPALFPAAASASGRYIANNTPAFVAAAVKTGDVSGSDKLTVSLWLRPRARAKLDAVAADLYNRASPNYRHWLKNSDILRDFAPTEAEIATVAAFAAQQGLTVQGQGPDRCYVRAEGSASAIEKAFHVKLSNYKVGTRTFRANGSDPYIEGPAAALVQVVSGLDNAGPAPETQTQSASFATPSNVPGEPLSAASAKPPSGFSSSCFLPPDTKTYSTHGGFPKGAYTGNVYQTAKSGCGYTPSDIVKAYHLDQLYSQGLDGTGQTIALIETCGTPTITDDANVFSQAFGLPALTPANFTVTNYPAPSTCSGVNASVAGNVEWIHALAPGANIMLVVAPTTNADDFDSAIFYAISSGVPQVISGDYWIPEYEVGTAEAQKTNLICEIAATTGIAVNFPSGNNGYYHYDIEFPPEASFPADLPFATGVGGVTAALNTDGSLAFQTAWATHVSNLVVNGAIMNPPQEPGGIVPFGYQGSSGGGASVFFPKPPFQAALQGDHRKVPDIAWLADRRTGGLILMTQGNFFPPQEWHAYGGTELANSMFSAVWTIAGQAAGAPLGQAANTLYHVPASYFLDIASQGSPSNVRATVATSASSSLHFSPAKIFAQPNSHLGPFYSAIDVEPGGNVNAISFGQDYYQHPAAGWDSLTGLGVLDAPAFVTSLLPAVPVAK